MTMSVIDAKLDKRELNTAAAILRRGGVIAYPTESCFGLGCDPNNSSAVRRLLKIKRRSYRKGLILIAANVRQSHEFANIHGLPKQTEILNSWPGPNTWLLPPTHRVSRLVRGQHEKIAIRVTAHSIAAALCDVFGSTIVSTSANLQGKAALKTSVAVRREFGQRLDFVVSGNVGGDDKPSTIRDGLSGKILRK